jgi:L-lactate utilization protein LutC
LRNYLTKIKPILLYTLLFVTTLQNEVNLLLFFIIMQWNTIPSDKIIQETASALKANGITPYIVTTAKEAKEKLFSLIPKGASVMDMSSVTLETISIVKELHQSGNYDPIKPKLFSMDRKTQELTMNQLGAAPEWTIGSVHAVTRDGKVLIASNTGSQLPAYAYGSPHVIWVVGAQKIVDNVDEGIKRIYEYVLPLENERAQKAYGMKSNVSKLLIINKEINPTRLTLILVKEVLGF